jgi:hypothetical protein
MSAVSKSSPAADAAACGSDGVPDPIVVGDELALRDMVSHLLGDRAEPVLGYGFASSLGEVTPAVAVARLRPIVGPTARIYLVADERELDGLEQALGRRLALMAESVRVWWPGLGPRSDPGDHPFVLSEECELDMLAELSLQFDLSRPHVRREIKLIDDVRALAERQVREAEEKERITAQRLRDAHVERHRETSRAEAALRLAGERLEGMDCEQRMHALISRQWRETLTPVDRRAHPLGRYVLSLEFLATIEHQPAVSLPEIAQACMLIACGDPGLLAANTSPSLLVEPDGSALQHSEGAEAWRCALNPTPVGGLWLRYWIHGDATVEFVALGDDEQSSGDQ